MLRRLALAVALAAAPAAAQEGAPITPPSPLAFAPVVDQLIDLVIVPGYEALDDAAADAEAATGALCAAPGTDSLARARDAFGALAVAWSGVEMFRIGPAREDNRYERIFFWPDRKGVGLRQVQAILREEDTTATDAATLRGKSVAVQGLPALEYALFGTDSDTLATPDTAFRCSYALAVAGAIATTSSEMRDGWLAPHGYASIMRTPGSDNPVYRSHGEVVQDIVRSARELIQIVRDIKIARPIGESPADAIPTLAPFWRSNLTIPTIRANLDAAKAILTAGGVGAMLPAGAEWMSETSLFELSAANAALARLKATGSSWEETVRSDSGHETLAYTLIPLGSVFDIFEQKLPVALGLVVGFNTLDGD